MKYYINREGQQYGPYTLADLQRYVADGSIQRTDLARAEDTEEWTQVERIIGNIAVQPPPPQPAYGQVPVYGSPAFGQAAGSLSSGPMPPGLHWAVVLLLAIVTCGLFSMIWLFVQAHFASKLQAGARALIYYGIGIPLLIVGQFLQEAQPEVGALSALLILGGFVLTVIGHFNIKGTLEDYYSSVEPMNLRLSGVMTFFFNVFYFQYHLSRIRDWKLTGSLR